MAEAVSSSESDQNDATTAPIPIIDLLQPAITGLCHASQKAHFTAVHDQLLQPFLVACDQLSESEQRSKKRRKVVHAEEQPTDDGTDWQLVLQQPLCDLDGEPLAAELVPSQLLKLLFAAASKPEVSDANRRRLYQICRERTSDEDQSI